MKSSEVEDICHHLEISPITTRLEPWGIYNPPPPPSTNTISENMGGVTECWTHMTCVGYILRKYYNMMYDTDFWVCVNGLASFSNNFIIWFGKSFLDLSTDGSTSALCSRGGVF